MFFGWKKVSKKAHLTATWLVTLGATLSALWILIANAWMQYPIGMEFNPETVRNEMVDFWAIALSPVAINKFFHTVLSGWATGAAFVVAISAWFLLKKRHIDFALKSIKIGAIFGFFSFLLLAITGDGSGYEVAQKQPMKLAAMEGLYHGKEGAGLVAMGVLNPSTADNTKYADQGYGFLFKIELPKLLSLMGHRNLNAFVPGINDIIDGGYKLKDGTTALSFEEKRIRGVKAIEALANYQTAKTEGRDDEIAGFNATLQENFAYFGYGYLDTPDQLIPNVPLMFYTFRVMVMIGMFYILLFAIVWYFYYKKNTHRQ